MVIPNLRAWRVEASLAAESKNVLQRRDGKTCGGTLRQADQPPVWPILARSDQSSGRVALFGAQYRPSAHAGVIVMRAGVNDAVRAEPVRQVNVRADITESKLQNRHTGNVEPVA